MKQASFIAIAALAMLASGCMQEPRRIAVGADMAHTSQNALDWAGVYRGVIPCADCEGIETVVVLRPEGRFTALSRYLGKGDGEVFSREGRFTWNAAGSAVSLEGDAQYFVGEGRLTRLAADGSRITGALADRYVLARVPDSGIAGRYWRLVELNGQPLPQLHRQPWLMLGPDGQASGFGGCNRFTGAVTLDETASRIGFSRIATTSMACIAGMEEEAALHEVLRNTDNYSLSGDRLTLNRARMAPLARFEAVYLP
ncbi:MAG: META domain-containing protein [Novosphingobium sp.]|jgi:heat shock protein HslJ|nr:META domain-containing protein [Novosphingobium sp.]